MTRGELRNAINNACDIARREGLTTTDYMGHLSLCLSTNSTTSSNTPTVWRPRSRPSAAIRRRRSLHEKIGENSCHWWQRKATS